MTDRMRDRGSSRSAIAGLQDSQGERVLKALEKLYEKIQHLEEERNTAKENIGTIAEVSNQFEQPSASEFFRRLATAEARCKLLEEQLFHVKTIISEMTVDKIRSNSSSFNLSNNITINESKSVNSTTSETAHWTPLPPVSLFLQHLIQTKLKSNQYTNRKKKVIKQYTSSNQSEKGSYAPENAQQFDSQPKETQTDLLSVYSMIPHREETHLHFRKSSYETPTSQSVANCSRKCKCRCNETSKNPVGHYYHVNMPEIPFVSATTSNGKSHSLRANIQSLYSMIKYCNPALCSGAPALHSHHRRRSASLERPTNFSTNPSQGRGGRRLTRCNSASDLGSTKFRLRSNSAETNQSKRRLKIYEDLDIVPIQLKSLNQQRDCREDCLDQICVKKSETKFDKEDKKKVFEFKMSSAESSPLRASRGKERNQNGRITPQQEKRRLLQDLKYLQYFLKQD